jgi:hypothetical protein
VYKEVKSRAFDSANRYIKDIPRDQWNFEVCEKNHWVGVEIHWPDKCIKTYDPRQKSDPKGVCYDISMCVREWVKYLDPDKDDPWPWDVKEGEEQERDNFVDCGVFSSLWTCRRLQQTDTRFLPGLKPLDFRRKIFRLLQRSNRRTTAIDETGQDSDGDVIGMTAIVTFHLKLTMPEELADPGGSDRTQTCDQDNQPQTGIGPNTSRAEPARKANTLLEGKVDY